MMRMFVVMSFMVTRMIVIVHMCFTAPLQQKQEFNQHSPLIIISPRTLFFC